MTEPLIKVADLAWGRIKSPDLDVQEEFLTNFGMIKVERTNDKLFMRGTGASHHLHVTEKGDPGFVSLAFRADNEDDLHKLAAEAESASGVEEIDEPGGGKRVRLTEPNGYTIEIVHGIEAVDEIPVERQSYNLGNIDKYKRANELWRRAPGPATVMRIGHGVIGTPKMHECTAWIRHHIGLIASDEVFVEDEDLMDELFMPGGVSGKRPADSKLEWNVLGKRDRAALNENFARELPLEYRKILKDYYERLAR